MSKALVIYYSFEGNTRLIAESVAEVIGADLLDLKPKQDVKAKGFMKYFWGGRQVFRGQAPELHPFEKDLNDYDILFIGTPVWAFSFAPALKTFFKTVAFSNKKVAVFCCHGGGKMKTLEKIKAALSGNRIIGENDFNEPLKNHPDDNIIKARSWARSVVDSLL